MSPVAVWKLPGFLAGRVPPIHVRRLDLEAALVELPIEQRALVLMIDRDGFDYRAAATALSIPLGTVSSRLAAARAKLRDALAPDHERGDE